jgi:hypothetical protein
MPKSVQNPKDTKKNRKKLPFLRELTIIKNGVEE